MERDDAVRLVRPARLFIDGRFEDAADGAVADVVDPSRGATLTSTALAGAADVARAVEAARRALEGPWAAWCARDRGHLLRKLSTLLKRDADEAAGLETLESGAPYATSRADEIAAAVETFDYWAGLADKLEGRAPPLREGAAFTTHEPVGVVAVSSCFGAPHAALARLLAPAIACGDAVVADVSALAPLSAHRLARLIEECGFPPGVINLLIGLGAGTSRALAEHPGVDAIAFIGAAAEAADVAARAGAGLKRASLEIGGPAPQLVFADAGDPKALAADLVREFVRGAGQGPTNGSRVLVERSFYDALLPRLVEAANALRAGCPFDRRTTLGPLKSAAMRDAVVAAVDRAVAAGARLVAGGGAPDVPDLAGWFHRATLLAATDPAAAAPLLTVGGPVAVVIPFNDEDDAVRLAGACGTVAAGVLTKDAVRARRLARRLRVGAVWINGNDPFDPALPPAGAGAGGFAAASGAEASSFYSRVRITWFPDERR